MRLKALLAIVVVLTAGTLVGTPATAADSGRISGTVTGPSGEPLADVLVTLFGPHPVYAWDPVKSVSTDAQGRYVLDPVAPGTYRIGFGGRPGLASEFWNDVRFLHEASDVVVTSGASIEGKDAQLTSQGRITGTVTTSDGRPIAGITVKSSRWSTRTGGPGIWGPGPMSVTAADGTYSLAADPGRYLLEFTDPSEVYVSEFWNDSPRHETATAVEVAAGETVSGKDAQLFATGRITGRVTGTAGVPLPGMTVAVEGRGQPRFHHAITDAAGYYQVAGLAPGVYDVLFFDPQKGRYREEYWNDAVSKADATGVVVAEGQVLANIDGELSLGARITGKVVGPRNGRPLVQVQVSAYRWHPTRQAWEFRTFTDTDKAGRYRIENLPAGAYRLKFVDRSSKSYGTRYWRGSNTLEDAESFDVRAGETVSGMDAQLGSRTIVPLAKPRLSGQATLGATLKVTRGTWRPSDAKVAIQWYAGKRPIKRATRPALTLTRKLARKYAGKRIAAHLTVTVGGAEPLEIVRRARGVLGARPAR